MPGINRRSFLGAASLAGLALPPGGAFTAAEKTEISVPRAFVKLEPLSEWDAQLGFALDPPVEEWRPQPGEIPHQSVFVGGGYRLVIDFTHPESHLITFSFRLSREDGLPFVIHTYSIRSRKVFTDIYQFWNDRLGSPEIQGEFDVYTRGLASGDNFARTYAANTGIPLALCANREGRIRFAFGLLDQVDPASCPRRQLRLGQLGEPAVQVLVALHDDHRPGAEHLALEGEQLQVPGRVETALDVHVLAGADVGAVAHHAARDDLQTFVGDRHAAPLIGFGGRRGAASRPPAGPRP